VIVVWEPVTPSDHGVALPPTSVLVKVPDPRAAQFWDDDRALSKRMIADLPRDTLASVAQIESTGTAIVWDCVAVFRPGSRWDERFPVPDWAGRPVYRVEDALRRRLRAIESLTSSGARQ
jgi:hypothetical protein